MLVSLLTEPQVLFGGESGRPYAYWNDVWRLKINGSLALPQNSQAALTHYHMADSVYSQVDATTCETSLLSKNLMIRTRDDEQ